MAYEDVSELLKLPSTLAGEGDTFSSGDYYLWRIKAKSGASGDAVTGPFYFEDLFQFAQLVLGQSITQYGPKSVGDSDPVRAPKEGVGTVMVKNFSVDGYGGVLDDYEAELVRSDRSLANDDPPSRLDNQEYQVNNEAALRRSEPLSYPVGPQ